MFYTKKFKRFALAQMKKRWGVSVAMTLISYIVTFIIATPIVLDMRDSEIFSASTVWEYVSSGQNLSNLALASAVLYALAMCIFSVAQIYVYLKMSRSPEKIYISDFFAGFNLWFAAVREGVWAGIWLMFWSCLFWIPGVVKFFAYSQAFYIITEFPKVSTVQALKISKVITKGHKADLFMLNLSFIGWIVLAYLTGGIGFLWLIPYMFMTKVNAFHWLLQRAIDTRTILPEDLGITGEQN